MDCGTDAELEQEAEWTALMEPCHKCKKSGFECECPPACPKCSSIEVETGSFRDYGGECIDYLKCKVCGFEDYVSDGQMRWV
jgi:predicted Zn-ribbon and HTH transcriptional regulator